MRVTAAVSRRKRKNSLFRHLKGHRSDTQSSAVRGKTILIKKSTHKFRSRKLMKRNMKSLFIIRINAALRSIGISYSRFMNKMNNFTGIKLNRKVLQEMCFHDMKSFRSYVSHVMENSVKNSENLNSIQ